MGRVRRYLANKTPDARLLVWLNAGRGRASQPTLQPATRSCLGERWSIHEVHPDRRGGGGWEEGARQEAGVEGRGLEGAPRGGQRVSASLREPRAGVRDGGGGKGCCVCELMNNRRKK